MKLSYIILGILLIFGSSFFMQDGFVNQKIKNYGEVVNVEIIEKPQSCLGTKAKWFMKVKYKEKFFTKQIPGNFCEDHKIGDMIQVYYLEGTDRILLMNESYRLGFLLCGTLALVGLYILYLGITNNRNKIRK